jgi:hypothetical protein
MRWINLMWHKQLLCGWSVGMPGCAWKQQLPILHRQRVAARLLFEWQPHSSGR